MVHNLPRNSAKKLELSLEFFLSLKAHLLIPWLLYLKNGHQISPLLSIPLPSPWPGFPNLSGTSFPSGLSALLPYQYFSKEKLEWSLKNLIKLPWLDGSVSWSMAPCTKMFQVQSLIRAHNLGCGFDPQSGNMEGEANGCLYLTSMFLSL